MSEQGGSSVAERAAAIGISPPDWHRIGSGLSLVTTAALVAVVLGELDRLISSVPSGDGRSHSLNVVLSLAGPTKSTSWKEWAKAPLHSELGGWIAASAVLDLLLMAAIALLLLRVVDLVKGRPRRVPTIVLAIYVAAEGVEDLLQFAGGWTVTAGAPEAAAAIGGVMGWATLVKGLALVVFFVAILRIAPYRRRLAHHLARIAQAVWVHRLATLAILVIVVLSCIPAADLLDQLPDVQRQWADGFGWLHALAAVLALGATATVTFVLCRLRTRFLVETRALGLRRRPAKDARDAAAPWVIAPVVLLASAALVSVFALLFGAQPGIHLATLIPIVFVMTLVPALAFGFHWWVVARPEKPLGRDPERAGASWIVGDVLAVLVLAAGAIGVVRSYVVPLVLGGDVNVPSALVWAWVYVPLGSAAAILGPWLLLRWTGSRSWSRLDPTARAEETENADPNDAGLVSNSGPVEWSSLIVAVLFLVASMLVPSQIAWALGGVAVTLLAISAWVTVFGSFTLIVQSRELVAPFRWLRLRAAPVLTVGFLLPFAVNVIVSSISPDRSLHAVQVSNPERSVVATEGLLERRLEDLQEDEDCAIDVGDARVRPVYLIAAEGGGIRAAFWTASALATLEGCAARSGFVSSGISGGSVGLAVASTVDDEPGGAPNAPAGLTEAQARAALIVERAKRVAGPDVVSTVMLGLAVGDAFAAGTGVHVPSYLPDVDGADDSGWRWRDRAALVEALWERAAPGLSTAFSAEIDPLTGMLMLSSTDVVSKCRLLVDQAPIVASEETVDDATSAAESGARSTTEGSSCDTAGGLPSMLGFREMAASGGSDATTKCLASLDWSTAAMLSARFAIVTPTGVLPAQEPCNVAENGAQFVDGGYVEPTSLAALADTAPRLMALIAAQNGERADEEDPWLLPVLLYLRNTQGYDLADDVARTESEPLVPITGGAAKAHLTAEDAWIQRITLAMPGACPDGQDADACHTALEELIREGGLLPGGTVVIAPGSTPAVVPPLGWALSEMSQSRFTSAIRTAAGCDPGDKEEASEVPTRNGRYTGLEGFELDVVDFERCSQVTAQHKSRIEPDSAE